MSSIKLSSQIDFSKIQFQSPTLNSYGGKMAKVTYDEKWALIQTPSLKCPFGLNIYDDADSKTYSFDVSINKNIPKEDEFLNFLKVRKKFWLVPIFLLLLIFGALFVVTQGTALAPFIYTIF